MADLHGWLGRFAFLLAGVVTAWLLVLVATHRVPGRQTILMIGISTAAIGIVALIGLLTAILSGPPHDALHWLYAVLAIAALPIAALIGASRPARQQAFALFLGALALVVFVVRLIQTGS